MFKDIVSASYIKDYIVFIEFDNGVKGIVDLSGILDKGIMTDLQDTRKFRQFKVEYGTIVWSNGADYSADALYDLMQEQLKDNLQPA